MKTTMTVFLTLVLFCATAFADGDMGGGGKTCTQNCGLANIEPTTKIDKSFTFDLFVLNLREVFKAIF